LKRERHFTTFIINGLMNKEPWTKPSRTYGNGWLHIGPCPWLVCPKAIAFRADLYSAVVYFLFFHHEISELRWPITAKFCMLLESVFNFIILFQNFAVLPKKILKRKTCKIWLDFWTTSKISGEYLQNGWRYFLKLNKYISTKIPPAFCIFIFKILIFAVKVESSCKTHYFQLWLQISLKRMEISTSGKRHYQLQFLLH